MTSVLKCTTLNVSPSWRWLMGNRLPHLSWYPQPQDPAQRSSREILHHSKVLPLASSPRPLKEIQVLWIPRLSLISSLSLWRWGHLTPRIPLVMTFSSCNPQRRRPQLSTWSTSSIGEIMWQKLGSHYLYLSSISTLTATSLIEAQHFSTMCWCGNHCAPFSQWDPKAHDWITLHRTCALSPNMSH